MTFLQNLLRLNRMNHNILTDEISTPTENKNSNSTGESSTSTIIKATDSSYSTANLENIETILQNVPPPTDNITNKQQQKKLITGSFNQLSVSSIKIFLQTLVE